MGSSGVTRTAPFWYTLLAAASTAAASDKASGDAIILTIALLKPTGPISVQQAVRRMIEDKVWLSNDNSALSQRRSVTAWQCSASPILLRMSIGPEAHPEEHPGQGRAARNDRPTDSAFDVLSHLSSCIGWRSEQLGCRPPRRAAMSFRRGSSARWRPLSVGVISGLCPQAGRPAAAGPRLLCQSATEQGEASTEATGPQQVSTS